jgi:hypothetical protein
MHHVHAELEVVAAMLVEEVVADLPLALIRERRTIGVVGRSDIEARADIERHIRIVAILHQVVGVVGGDGLLPFAIETETITVADPTGKGPLGPTNTTFTVPTYTGYGNTALLGASAANFSTITEYLSNINSSYNALALEVQNRSLKSLQFDVNYTWAHALDYSQNASTAGNINNWYDPYGNPRANYGNSTWDIKDRLVAYALYSFPNLQTGTWLKYVTNNWKLDDSFQIQSGMPYSANVGGDQSAAIGGGWNGSGGSGLIPALGFNNLFERKDIVDDVRLEKDFALTERYNLQLMVQAFNVANHQNVTEVYSTAYELSGETAIYQGGQASTSAFGTTETTNNSGFNFAPRQVELSARFKF